MRVAYPPYMPGIWRIELVETQDADLSFIQRCVRAGRLLWTYHVNMRLVERGVSRSMVVESVDLYSIIEHYPRNLTSHYLPSCLVYSEHRGIPIHILFAIDKEGDTVRVITVYKPSPTQWVPGFLQRRKP